jgi:hypothetical protein
VSEVEAFGKNRVGPRQRDGEAAHDEGRSAKFGKGTHCGDLLGLLRVSVAYRDGGNGRGSIGSVRVAVNGAIHGDPLLGQRDCVIMQLHLKHALRYRQQGPCGKGAPCMHVQLGTGFL